MITPEAAREPPNASSTRLALQRDARQYGAVRKHAVPVFLLFALAACNHGSPTAPPASPAPTVSVAALTLDKSAIVGGAPVTGTVELSAAAPTGGTTVTMSSTQNAARPVVADDSRGPDQRDPRNTDDCRPVTPRCRHHRRAAADHTGCRHAATGR